MVTFRHKPAIPKPFLKPAMDVAMGYPLISEDIAKKIEAILAKPSVLASMPRTPSTGIVHKWAPDSGPRFPFGTVLKDKYTERLRVMSLGGGMGMVLEGEFAPAGEIGPLGNGSWEEVI